MQNLFSFNWIAQEEDLGLLSDLTENDTNNECISYAALPGNIFLALAPKLPGPNASPSGRVGRISLSWMTNRVACGRLAAVTLEPSALSYTTPTTYTRNIKNTIRSLPDKDARSQKSGPQKSETGERDRTTPPTLPRSTLHQQTRSLQFVDREVCDQPPRCRRFNRRGGRKTG
jgi:hypothetical protein